MTADKPGQDPLERALARNQRGPAAMGRWRDGVECPTEFELAAYAEGLLEEGRHTELRDHLAHCGHCLELVRGAVEELELAEGETPVFSLHRVLSRRAVGWLLAAAAALLLALPLLLDIGQSEASVVELARIEALVPPRPRAAPSDEREALYWSGLEAYGDARWSEAVRDLSASHGQAQPGSLPRAESALFLGSALLFGGDPYGAVPILNEALTSVPEGYEALGDDLRWLRAQCLLAANRGRDARVALEELAGGDGHWAKESRELLEQL